jgi:DNA-binding NarL/FixJ family response regulator
VAINVLLVDDHPLFRKGIRLILEEQKDIRIVGEAGDGQEAIDRVRALSPDVVIMDITMPNFNGIEATRQIVSEIPSTKVVALSMHSKKRFVEDMLRAGAAGYILKKSIPEDLVNGIRTVNQGEIYLSPTISGIVVSEYIGLLEKSSRTAQVENASSILITQSPPLSTQPLAEPLTNRELDVLELLAQRFRNKEIAEKLVISPETVKKHLNNIYGKLNISSRRQAVEKAQNLGILSPPLDRQKG